LADQITPAVKAVLGPDDQSLSEVVTVSLRELFAVFGGSECYARLRAAAILGREVPFVMPWGEHQVMEGVIDLIYRLGGSLWIADYKTDTVTSAQAQHRAERYWTQSDVYKTAVKRSLGIADVRFECLFLRSGTAIEL
jgi:ATP-dependent helicase/nuclease subunit A